MHESPSIDESVLEALLHALLEVAARKDALRAWPRDQPPDVLPPMQAQREDDGTLGVFRFFTIVGADARADAVRELTADEARTRIEGIEGPLRTGDEVGVELPLGRLAAIALADLEATRDALGSAIDDTRRQAQRFLPQPIVEMLSSAALASAVAARLSSLRGPPPHVPLRRLVTDYGGDVVEWTAVCGESSRTASAGGASSQAGELVVLVSRGGEHRLVVVPTATSSGGHAALLRALAPQPTDQSLWRFLELEGPALLCGEGSLWSEEDGLQGEASRRLSLEVKSIAISRDPTVYGVAGAKARLLTWSGDKIVDEVEATVGLPVDLPRLISEPWPQGEALERVRAAAELFRLSLQARLSALLGARQPAVADALAGAGFLRVLARAAAGEPSAFPFDNTVAEALELREVTDAPAAWPPDEIGVRVADVGVLVLSPADDVVKLRGVGPLHGDDVVELFADGALVDGDVEGWRAFTDVFAQAIADADDVDVELSFRSEDGAEVETVMLSEWLLALGEPPAIGSVSRWPPRPRAAESAQALQLLVDRFVDAGPDLRAAANVVSSLREQTRR